MKFLHGEPNPLNVLEIRELNFCPRNWTTVKIGNNNWNIQRDIENCRQWIYNNLDGRFCIVSDTEIVNNKMEIMYKIGFEEPSESTMFSLGCSVLHDRGVPLY